MSRFHPPISLVLAGPDSGDFTGIHATLSSFSIQVTVFSVRNKQELKGLRAGCIAAGCPVIAYLAEPALTNGLAQALGGLVWVALIPARMASAVDPAALDGAFAVEQTPLPRNRLLTTVAKAILAQENNKNSAGGDDA